MSTNILTDRDRAIIATVELVRAATASQLRALFFPGRSDAPFIRRMKLLLELEELHRTSFHTSVGGRPQYVYTRKKTKAGYLFLSHMIDITEVYTRFRLTGASLSDWENDSILKKQGGPIIPDAAFVITTDKPYRFLLEVDKGTEPLNDIAEKFTKYREYFHPFNGQSAYEQKYKTDKGRVLCVAPSPQRMQHMKAVCEQQGGRMRYWFTSMQELKTHNVLSAPIWQRAGSEEFFPLI